MRKLKWWIIIPLVLLASYVFGPSPEKPHFSAKLPTIPSEPVPLQQYVQAGEARHKIKPDNEARIVWANDSARSKTEYSILYLHGFSASQGEGDPVHKDIAKQFGCNLYLARLAQHGIDTTEPLATLTAEALWESAKEAYSIASKLGEKVIVIGTSTGGTLALMLSAQFPDVHAQVLLSPNIRIFDKNAWLLNNPWGLQIARLVNGSDYIYSDDTRPIYKQYWSYGYRIEALTELEELLENQMVPETFAKVKQPTLMLYYYKNEAKQDSVVRVDAMLKMFDELGTPKEKKAAKAMPATGNHVLGSHIKSADINGVKHEIALFMTNTLHMKSK